MSEKERIEVLINRAGSGRKLAELIHTTSSSITKLKDGRFRIGAFADRLALAFPDMNCRWLLTGEGEPFSQEVTDGEIKAELRALNEKMDRLSKKRSSPKIM